MICKLKHKKSSDNAIEDLKKGGIISETRQISTKKQQDALNIFRNNLKFFYNESYNTNFKPEDKLFNIVEGVLSDNSKGYFVEPNKELFDKVDEIRKKLNLYDLRTSFAEYTYGQEIGEIEKYTEGVSEYVVEDFGLYNENTGTPIGTDKQSLVSAQYSRIGLDNVTKEMSDTVKTLLDSDSLITLNDDNSGYTFEKTKEIFRRVSDYIKDFGDAFIYKGDDSDYSINREYGNQIDFIYRYILENGSKNNLLNAILKDSQSRFSPIYLTEDVIDTVANSALDFIRNNRDKIILTQVGFYNERVKIAGKADIVTIDKAGKIKIYDVKSSIKSTQTDSSGNNLYTKRFYNSNGDLIGVSKKERHRAQLSLYYGMGLSKGLKFEEEAIAVLPYYLPEIDTDNTVTDVVSEPIIELDSFPNFTNKVINDYNTDVNFVNFSKKMEEVLLKIKKSVQQRINQYKEDPRKAKKIKYLNSLLRQLSNDSELKSISKFIEDAKRTFFDKNYGIQTRLRNLNNQIGVLDSSDIITDLSNIHDEIETYENVLKELVLVFQQNKIQDENFDLDSVLYDLNNLYGASAGLLSEIKDRVIPLISKELYKFMDDKASTKLNKELEYLDKRYKEYKKQGNEKQAEYILTLINKLKESSTLTEESLEQELQKGSVKDVSFIDYLLTPAINSNNAVVSLVAKKLKTVLENVRQNSISFLRDNYKYFEEYKSYIGKSSNNPASFNEGLYNIVTYYDKATGEEYKKVEFIQRIDKNKYNKARKEFYDKYADLKEKDFKEFKKKEKEWYSNNTETIPFEDTVITLNGEKIVIEKGINSLINEKKAVLSKEEYQEYINSVQVVDPFGNITYSGREFTRPSKKYESAEFKNLKPQQLKYYNFLIATYFKAQEKFNIDMNYELPQINKIGYDRYREGSTKEYLMYLKKDLGTFTSEDINKTNVSGDKIVPKFFTQKIPVEDVSLDLFSSVIRFNDASMRYSELSKFSYFANLTLDVVKKNTPVENDSLGRKLVDSAAKTLGIQGWDSYKKKNQSNQAALLEAFIDMQVYGILKQSEKANIFGKEVNLGKWGDTLINFGSKVALPFNLLQGVSNSLQANVTVQIEAAANEYFGNKEFAKSEYIYDTSIVDLLSDFSSPYAKSLLGQLIELYDPLQGEYKDNYGRRITQTTAKKLWSEDRIFFLQNAGEHHIQVKTLIAFLLKSKIKNNKGEEISLFDAYELDKNGKIKLKEGFKLKGFISNNGLVDISIQNKIHSLNKRFHGIYNSFDQSTLQRYVLGRMVMNFRKFIAPGFKKRFKSVGYDNELEDFTEGTYSTFLRLAYKESNELFKFLFFKENNLSDLEKLNLKRSLAELGWIMSMTVLSSLLLAAYKGEDDDDDKYLLSYPVYWTLRLSSELRFFTGISVGDLTRIIKYPIPAQNTLENGFELIGQFFNYDEQYKRKSGVHNKGDYKLPAKALKFLGYSGNSFNPEEVISQMEQSSIILPFE